MKLKYLFNSNQSQSKKPSLVEFGKNVEKQNSLFQRDLQISY